MNLIIIVLSISVIFYLYILIKYFRNNSTKLVKQASLLTINATLPNSSASR